MTRERAGSIAAVVAIHVALAYALLSGLAVELPRRVAQSLATFTVLPPSPKPVPPPPAPRPKAHRAPRKEGAAAPPNRTATATDIVAPPLVIPPPKPPPVVAATTAGTGTADHQGAAPVPGPGTGSGGVGNGTGNGRDGDGPGGGGDGRPFELISRGPRDSDFPRGMPLDRRRYGVRAKIIIGITGRVTGCSVVRPSESAVFNAAICPVLTKRLRFRPTLDAAGRPVPDYSYWDHVWTSGEYDPGD